MSEHTPGKLEVSASLFDNEGCPETVIVGVDKNAFVAVAIDFGENNPGMRDANARRLVACWNALEDLPQDALDGGWTRAGLEAYGLQMKAERDSLRAVNADLLAALMSVKSKLRIDDPDDMYDMVCAAIAKAAALNAAAETRQTAQEGHNMTDQTTAPAGVVSSTELGAGDVVWVRHNGKPHTSGVAHFGGECPPGWVGGAKPFFSVDYLTKAIEKYATVCAGVAREECRGDRANPDYQAREAARAAYIAAIKDAEERIRATLIVEGERPEKMREAIAQRVADLGKHPAPNTNSATTPSHNTGSPSYARHE